MQSVLVVGVGRYETSPAFQAPFARGACARPGSQAARPDSRRVTGPRNEFG